MILIESHDYQKIIIKKYTFQLGLHHTSLSQLQESALITTLQPKMIPYTPGPLTRCTLSICGKNEQMKAESGPLQNIPNKLKLENNI